MDNIFCRRLPTLIFVLARCINWIECRGKATQQTRSLLVEMLGKWTRFRGLWAIFIYCVTCQMLKPQEWLIRFIARAKKVSLLYLHWRQHIVWWCCRGRCLILSRCLSPRWIVWSNQTNTQGFVCVARAAYSPPSCVLACYWSIVVCYWSISQSQTTTQLGGEKAALHKVQQHKQTLVVFIPPTFL